MSAARKLLSYQPKLIWQSAFKRFMQTMTGMEHDKIGWQAFIKDLDPKQVEFYHSEKLIKVDDKDSVIGPISKGESHAIDTIRKNIYHRALSLLIFDEQERFLLTQRASCKITFPDYFTNACCSHPLYNEKELEDDGNSIGVRRATVRRANFELGTNLQDIKPDQLKFVNKIAYRAESDGGLWGEAEIDYIFVLKGDFSLQPNPEEIRSYRFVTREQMQDILKNHGTSDIKITPWMRLLGKDFLFKYWSNLDNLDSIADTQHIVDYKNHYLEL